MRPYVASRIPSEERELFWRVWLSVWRLPDEIDLGLDDEGRKVELSCHILARAVETVFFPDLKCIDGYFSTSYNHSWLVTASGHIIDVYPVGTLGGALMRDGERPSPWAHLYRELDVKEIRRRYSDLFKQRWFIRAVALATRALKRAAKEDSCEDIEVGMMAEMERLGAESECLFMGMSSH